MSLIRHLPAAATPSIVLIGTTGAGKSTLARHLLGTTAGGTFPASSSARTTAVPTVVHCEPTDTYSARVSLRGPAQVRSALMDNVQAAVRVARRGAPDHDVASALMVHSSLSYRFDQMLGEFRTPGAGVSRGRAQLRHELWIAYVRGIAASQAAAPPVASADREAGLVDQIMLALGSSYGSLAPDRRYLRGGWPRHWSTQSASRDSFLAAIHPFTGNARADFGQLLGPLVAEVNVRGPFGPSWLSTPPDMRLLDAEGLGQDAEAATTDGLTPTHLRAIDECDRIVVVDSAVRPHGLLLRAALTRIAMMGAAGKLTVVHTHADRALDDVREDLDDVRAKVAEDADNGLSAIRRRLSPHDYQVLADRLDRGYLLGWLDQPESRDELASESAAELRALVAELRTRPDDDRRSAA